VCEISRDINSANLSGPRRSGFTQHQVNSEIYVISAFCDHSIFTLSCLGSQLISKPLNWWQWQLAQ